MSRPSRRRWKCASTKPRRVKLTTIAISDEAREDAVLTANSAAASYQQAIADHSTAQLNLDRTILRAPVNGFITNLTLEVGQYASVGTKIMALIDSDSYRVTAYFEETKIPATHLGEEAKIYLLDGSPALRGHVQSIARGITDRDNTGGPELLVNPNPTFEWVRLAQRIPVRIRCSPKKALLWALRSSQRPGAFSEPILAPNEQVYVVANRDERLFG
jgi:multidrug resistance efflux pump